MIPIKFGNNKLNKKVMVFNLGSALDCESAKLNLCEEIINKSRRCYAQKAEITYPAVKPYRDRQLAYWDNNTKEIISFELSEICKKKKPSFFRYNESGDFRNQNDVDKLSYIAEELKKVNVITYGYTARKDLDFSNVSFIVRGSGWISKNGQTKVIEKTEKRPEGFVVCPDNDCGNKCKLCMKESRSDSKLINIAFRKH